jgi:K+-transporting ATPase A subunit
MEGGGFLGHPLVMPYENQQPSTNMTAICLLSSPHSDNLIVVLEASDDGYPSLLVLVFEPV